MSIFKAPKKVIVEIDKLRRRFLWGSNANGNTKICWVDWKTMMKPKELGGLGIGSIHNINTSLLVKWWWRFKNEENALWRKVIKAIHGVDGLNEDDMCKKRSCGVWARIVKAGQCLSANNINLDDLFYKKINSGAQTKFWTENWLGFGKLSSLFPELFECETNKNCSISDKWIGFSNNKAVWRWSWCENRNMDALRIKLNELEELLKDTKLSVGSDDWKWRGEKDGSFTVSSLRKLLDQADHITIDPRFSWNRWMPPRVNCFLWRCFLNKIPTRNNLLLRGVNVPETNCIWCEEAESVEHIFLDCGITKKAWKLFLGWCQLDVSLQHNSISEFVKAIIEKGRSKYKRRFLEVASGGMIWAIWKARNNRIFNNVATSAEGLMEEVKVIVFTWIKHRASFNNLDWTFWCICPIDFFS